MTKTYEKLMSPGMIGPIHTRNRILKTANGTSYMEEDQTVGDRMIAYYERLAKGGGGDVVVGAVELRCFARHVSTSGGRAGVSAGRATAFP